MDNYNKLFDKHTDDLETINKQRRWWLIASSVFFVIIILLIFVLNLHEMATIWWVVASTCLLVTVNWWYWTMRIINALMEHKRAECKLLKDLVDEISAVKTLIS